MKVWRVEHGEKQDSRNLPYGPYRAAGEVSREGLAGMYQAHSDRKHQTPIGDPMLNGIDYDEVCGMDSRSALDEWFSGWTEVLDSLGFLVSVYEVPAGSVRKGSHGQVLFRYCDARRIANEFWSVAA